MTTEMPWREKHDDQVAKQYVAEWIDAHRKPEWLAGDYGTRVASIAYVLRHLDPLFSSFNTAIARAAIVPGLSATDAADLQWFWSTLGQFAAPIAISELHRAEPWAPDNFYLNPGLFDDLHLLATRVDQIVARVRNESPNTAVHNQCNLIRNALSEYRVEIDKANERDRDREQANARKW